LDLEETEDLMDFQALKDQSVLEVTLVRSGLGAQKDLEGLGDLWVKREIQEHLRLMLVDFLGAIKRLDGVVLPIILFMWGPLCQAKVWVVMVELRPRPLVRDLLVQGPSLGLSSAMDRSPI
jgi:hypothetical protein